jgi:protein-disulfide isomerase
MMLNVRRIGRTRARRHARILKVAAAIAVLFAPGSPAAAQDPPNPLVEKASASRAKGKVGAPIFVYEYADFQCPHCARFATEIFPRIDSAFVKTGKVHWIFVNLPLPNHPNAWVAHEAAVCAGAVADRFWAMHDRLFASQQEWQSSADPSAYLARIAKEAGVPAAPYADCVAGDKVAPLLLQDVIFAASSRVNGTPAFVVNNETAVMGLKSYDEWKEILDKALKSQAAKN